MSKYQMNWPQSLPPRDEGGYIRTATGQKFWPLNPVPADVNVQDIAFALGNTARWGGHCKFYSVAQHAVMCASLAISHGNLGIDPYRMLHHDDSEGYMCDLPRPIKRGIPDFKRVEDNLQMVIGLALGFSWPMTP